MNTSVRGNFSNSAAGLPKLVARTLSGSPANHCDWSTVSYTPLLNPIRTRDVWSPVFSIECR